MLFVLILSKFFWCIGLVRELITERSPVQSYTEKFFIFFFAQKSNFLQINGNIHASHEIKNTYQWSVLIKKVNERLMEHVKEESFKAS